MFAITAAQTAAAMYPAYAAQESQNAQLEYNSKVLERNAEIARQKAVSTKVAARTEAYESAKRTAAFIGRQRALMGASGAVVGEGNFMDIQLDAAAHGAYQQMAIIYNADLEAWNYEAQAVGMETSAQFLENQQMDPWTPAIFAGLQSAMGSAGSLYQPSSTTTTPGTGISTGSSIGLGGLQ